MSNIIVANLTLNPLMFNTKSGSRSICNKLGVRTWLYIHCIIKIKFKMNEMKRCKGFDSIVVAV